MLARVSLVTIWQIIWMNPNNFILVSGVLALEAKMVTNERTFFSSSPLRLIWYLVFYLSLAVEMFPKEEAIKPKK